MCSTQKRHQNSLNYIALAFGKHQNKTNIRQKSAQNGPSKPSFSWSSRFLVENAPFSPTSKNVKTPPEGRIQGEGRRQKPQPGLQCCSDLLRSKNKFLGRFRTIGCQLPAKFPRTGSQARSQSNVPKQSFKHSFASKVLNI